MLQRKGRCLIIVPAKHVMAEKLAKSTASAEPIMEQYKLLCNGAPLPTDNVEVAKTLLDDLIKQMKERHIAFDISDLPLTTSAEINIARQRLENILLRQMKSSMPMINAISGKKLLIICRFSLKAVESRFMMKIMPLKCPRMKHRRILSGHFGEQLWQLITW